MKWLSTMMECAHCKHQWVAVHRATTSELECPSKTCGKMTLLLPGPTKDIPTDLPRCMVCGWFHGHDDECVECKAEGDDSDWWKKGSQ